MLAIVEFDHNQVVFNGKQSVNIVTDLPGFVMMFM